MRRIRNGHSRKATTTPRPHLVQGAICLPPRLAIAPVEITRVEVIGALPGVMVVGEKVHVSPTGNPPHENAIDWVKPAFGVMVAVNFADCPEEIVCEDGVMSIVKLGGIVYVALATELML